MLHKTITPIFCDTDALGHISNTAVPRWLESARDPLFRFFTPDLDPKKWQLIIARIELDFMAQMYYGQDVEVKTGLSRLGNSSMHVAQEIWQQDTLAIKGLTVLIHFDYAAKKSVPIPDEVRSSLQAHLIDGN